MGENLAMTDWYKEDLAYIHDVGYRDYALKSTPGILQILAQHNIRPVRELEWKPSAGELPLQFPNESIGDGLIVELGCGSGLSAEKFVEAGFRVLGIDLSAAMVAIAHKRVPTAEFRVESFFNSNIPPCNAVISIGECLNYRFDPNNTLSQLRQLFHRIYHALVPGGLFIFDLIEAGQEKPGTSTQSFTEGKDWIVLVEKEENRAQATLTRRIVTFRKIGEHSRRDGEHSRRDGEHSRWHGEHYRRDGEHYRRDDEIHSVQLYRATEIVEALQQVGFHCQLVRHYGSYPLPKAHAAFIACKPRLC